MRVDDLSLPEIVGSRVQRRADADADQPAVLPGLGLLVFPLVPADQCFGLIEQGWVIARILHAAVRSFVGEIPNVISEANFIGGNA